MQKDFDIIIVGSGVGGATMADYLSKGNPNLNIAILESGPYYERSFFNQREIDMTGLYFNQGAVLAENLEIGVAAANTIGGSSSVYTGVSFRPPTSVLSVWREKFGMIFLSDDYVSSSLDEIEKDISIHELPPSWDNKNNLLFCEGAKELGINVKRLKINIKDCQQQGFCNLGCTSGAKQGTLEVQIPRVISRGVEVIANAYVKKVGENKVYCQISEATKGSKPNKYKTGEYVFTAKRIVLAAGVLNTPAILLRSKKELSIANDTIGRYLTLHPAMNVNAVHSDLVKGYIGFPKTVYSDTFSESDHFYLETSFYYPGLTAKNNPGYGALHSEFMRDYAKMMSILILVHDEAEWHNRISIDRNGNPIVNYNLNAKSKKSLVKALQVATKLFFKAGCKKALIPGSIKSPLTTSDMDNLNNLILSETLNFSKTPMSSAHPQGGSRMGVDPDNCVCDIDGKVYGTDSIYVSDASLFPTSVKVNPYETIMLLSKRLAEETLRTF
jgi:choline dehydrogenase-like flavoprotein